MRMVWNSTGDSIDLEVLLPEVFEYYLDKQPNHFYVADHIDPTQQMQQLLITLGTVNSYLSKLGQEQILPPTGYSQVELGRVHAQWVELHRKYPKIEQICKRFDTDAPAIFSKTNKIIHFLEESFVAFLDNRSDVIVKNPFHSHILRMGNSNVQIQFHNLGRTTFNRWLNFAVSEWDDTNNFEELWGHLRINLNRPYEQTMPNEYKDWCKENRETPAGERILLANFRDLEKNLSTYRQMWVDNMGIANNYVSFVQ